MRCRLPNIIEELLKILLILEYILIKVCHLGHAHNLAALLQEGGDAYVLCESKQRVQITQDLLVAALFVKLFEVFPVALERTLIFDHISEFMSSNTIFIFTIEFDNF